MHPSYRAFCWTPARREDLNSHISLENLGYFLTLFSIPSNSLSTVLSILLFWKRARSRRSPDGLQYPPRGWGNSADLVCEFVRVRFGCLPIAIILRICDVLAASSVHSAYVAQEIDTIGCERWKHVKLRQAIEQSSAVAAADKQRPYANFSDMVVPEIRWIPIVLEFPNAVARVSCRSLMVLSCACKTLCVACCARVTRLRRTWIMGETPCMPLSLLELWHAWYLPWWNCDMNHIIIVRTVTWIKSWIQEQRNALHFRCWNCDMHCTDFVILWHAS